MKPLIGLKKQSPSLFLLPSLPWNKNKTPYSLFKNKQRSKTSKQI